nr:unnamed protein product [Digitaria exilis]
MSAVAPPAVDPAAAEEMAQEAAAWCALHGLVVGDRANPRSATVPGVGLVHAPFSLLPARLPEHFWRQACELAPIFNELVDRVSLDGDFLQDSLSKTLINHYGHFLSLEPKRVPGNAASSKFAEALAKAWAEFNVDSAVVMMIIQPEERNMYDQYWLTKHLKESYPFMFCFYFLRSHMASQQLGKHCHRWRPKGRFYQMEPFWCTDNKQVAVVYYRAGYTPNDYPSEAEWSARLLIEQSSAVKCPSISYHLVGTKKIQQELAKPNVLERFLENKEDIAKLRKCFAGLWSLDDEEIIKTAIEKPELFVLKPQREGGGNNIYGLDLRETLTILQKEGGDARAAYILMQRIFPEASLAYLVRDGISHEGLVISELGIYGAYLRNKDKVVINDQCGYLMRTKVSSSDEGGVAAGFAVLDSLYLTDKVILHLSTFSAISFN